MAIRCFGMTGLLGAAPPYGLNYSAGMGVLNDKLAKIPGVTCDRVYGWTEWRTIVQEINKRPANEGICIFGHSMGANSAPSIATSLKRSIAVLAGFDPTIWSYTPAIPSNVRKAICFYGTNWSTIIGHQKYGLAEGNTKTDLDLYGTSTTHVLIDDETKLHQIVIDAVKAML